AARKYDDGLGEVAEPELAHEEVVEVEGELARDVGVVEFFRGKGDGEADVEALRLGRAAVRGLHDSRAAAGAHDEAALHVVELLRPLGEPGSELAGGFVVGGHP